MNNKEGWGKVLQGPWGKTPTQRTEEVGNTSTSQSGEELPGGGMFAHVDLKLKAEYHTVHDRATVLLGQLKAHDSPELEPVTTSLNSAILSLKEVYNDYVFPDGNILSDFNLLKYADTTPEDALKMWINHINDYLQENGQ